MEKEKNFEFHFPLLIVKTKRGIRFMEKMGSSRVINKISWLILYIFPLIAAIGFYLILNSLLIYFTIPLSREVGRQVGLLGNVLIPGLNPYLPILYGWIAIAVGIAVHEMGHGILAKGFGLTVKSSGILFLIIIPIGAFVEIDDKELYAAKLKDSGRVLAAGPGNNIILSLITLGCLILLISSLTAVAQGVAIIGIVENSPAHKTGMMPGDVIVSLDNRSTPNLKELSKILGSLMPNQTVSLVVVRGDVKTTYLISLASYPDNNSKSFIGIQSPVFGDGSPASILNFYKNTTSRSILAFLTIPTFAFGQQLVPFSDTMHRFYTSPIGTSYFPIANLLFWIWFVNFNLAIFNALPIYPLDGGIFLRLLLRSKLATRYGERTIKALSILITLIILSIIFLMILIPYAG